MAQRVGLPKKNNEFGKRLRILIKLQSIFVYFYILFVYFTSIGIFLFSLYNYQPHSPLTSPRGTKRRVRGYYFTHMNFSFHLRVYFYQHVYTSFLVQREHSLLGLVIFLNTPHAWMFRSFHNFDSSNPFMHF